MENINIWCISFKPYNYLRMELLGYSLMEYLDEQKMTICPNLNILQNALVLISLLYAISQDQQKASNEKKSRVLPSEQLTHR